MSELKRTVIGMAIAFIAILVVMFGNDVIVSIYDYLFGSHATIAALISMFFGLILLFAFVEEEP